MPEQNVSPEPLVNFWAWLSEVLGGWTALQLIGVLLGLGFGIAAVFWIIRRVWPFVVRAVALVNALSVLPTWMDTVTADVKTVRHEVLPNSGKSLADAQNRTEAMVNKLVGDVAHVRRQQAALKTTQARLARKVEGIESSLQPTEGSQNV